MAKNIKIKKNIKKEDSTDDVKKIGADEEVEKDGGTLSDGVLDAFEEIAPVVDPLLEDETVLPEDEEDDEMDSGDYKPLDEW